MTSSPLCIRLVPSTLLFLVCSTNPAFADAPKPPPLDEIRLNVEATIESIRRVSVSYEMTQAAVDPEVMSSVLDMGGSTEPLTNPDGALKARWVMDGKRRYYDTDPYVHPQTLDVFRTYEAFDGKTHYRAIFSPNDGVTLQRVVKTAGLGDQLKDAFPDGWCPGSAGIGMWSGRG